MNHVELEAAKGICRAIAGLIIEIGLAIRSGDSLDVDQALSSADDLIDCFDGFPDEQA